MSSNHSGYITWKAVGQNWRLISNVNKYSLMRSAYFYSLWNDCVYKQFFFRSGQMFIMGERISFVPFQGNWDVIQSNFAMLWIYIWKIRYWTFEKGKFICSINLTIYFQFQDISFYIDMCISKPEIEIFYMVDIWNAEQHDKSCCADQKCFQFFIFIDSSKHTHTYTRHVRNYSGR